MSPSRIYAQQLMASSAPTVAPAAKAAPLFAPPPSRYQRRILDFVRFEQGNGVVLATAGAGKTSTLVQVAAGLPAGLRTCFLAFGRDAAAELCRRLPESTVTMTVHKLGRQVLKDALAGRGVKLRPVERGKYRRLIRAALADRQAAPPADGTGEEYLARLCQLSRLTLVDVSDDLELRELAFRFNLVPPIDSDQECFAHAVLPEVLECGVREALRDGRTDFTDLLHLPLILGFEPPRFDFVCVDEAQDYSALALAFTMRLIEPAGGGRLLFVGDARQSVYGFAGADSRALEKIVTTANATVLPLSVSYRCPRKHVELARHLAPEIEAAPAAPIGGVYWITDLVLDRWVREGDMVLCRANAPLVRTCLQLAATGRRAFLLGRDLAKQLGDLVRRALPEGTVNAAPHLATFAVAEESRLRRMLHGRPQEQQAVSELHDAIDCLRSLALNRGDRDDIGPAELGRHVAGLFQTTAPAVVLSTVHRAKGKEAARVFILYPELMPAHYARTSEALRGEACVQFVALTRARSDLVFVSSRECFTQPLSSAGQSAASSRTCVRPSITESSDSTAESRAGGVDDQAVRNYDPWDAVLEHARIMARQRR